MKRSTRKFKKHHNMRWKWRKKRMRRRMRLAKRQKGEL